MSGETWTASVYMVVSPGWKMPTEYDFDDKIHFYNALEVDVDIFMIVAEDSYTGKQFYLVAKLNNTRVYPNWSITSGNQYATINSNGKVTILSGTNNSLITVHASYNGFGKDKNITVSYSNQLSIEGPSSMVGTSGNLIALYNSSLVSPNWSITSGNAYATIDTTAEFKPDAVGKTKDYGIYQITPIYVEELNRLLGEQVYTHNQAFDIEKSVEMFNVMQEFKNPDHDIETAIYYHNKASWYKKKVLMNYETVKRYEELRSVIQDYNKPQNI